VTTNRRAAPSGPSGLPTESVAPETAGNGRQVSGRVSLQPRHLTEALPRDDRIAVEFLEWHVWQRSHGKNPAFELPESGGVGVFLTISHVQRGLREIGAPKRGKDYAAEILNEILPRLGLIEDSGEAKLPRVHEAHPDDPTVGPDEQRETGGRHAQPSSLRSRWWRVFRLPALDRLFSREGAYPRRSGHPLNQERQGEASLFRLLRCQGLVSSRRKKNQTSPGSVQWAFRHTGPP
jgi:hypothetical protein